jgi:hypothetical protein
MHLCSVVFHWFRTATIISAVTAALAHSALSAQERLRRAGGAERPSGRWVGQDGHDLVGPSSAPGPSDVQDIHIVLRGLPAGRAVESGIIKGLGGDEWRINGPHGPWRAELVRDSKSTSGDLYLEPSRVETGRPISVQLRFEGGAVVEFDVRGGKADPNLRMSTAALGVRWLGQDQSDRTGLGPAVGPDGLEDVHLALSNLSPKIEVKSVEVDVPGAGVWEFGTNPKGHNNAELIRRGDDPKHADLFFQPDCDLAGRRLTVHVIYNNDKTDRKTLTAGRTDPKLRMPASTVPPAGVLTLQSQWLGQDATAKIGDGDIHVQLGGLPRKPVAAAALSNLAHMTWVWKADERVGFETDPYPLPMSFEQSGDGSRADLHFPPDRDESGGSLTLRLLFRDGKTAVATIAGGRSDPALRAVGPVATRKTAKPGDDLNDLANRFGELLLTSGTYPLDRPLVLEKPVTIKAEQRTTLVFRQPASAQPWTAAIKIHAGRTTLSGFSVRFQGQVRWNWGASYGPAVIGSTDDQDSSSHPLKAGLVLSQLDLEAPAVPGPSYEPAPSLIRLVTALNGRIEGNTLKGGGMELAHGPWQVIKNTYNGTVPFTKSPAVISIHWLHDTTIARNTAVPRGPSGKTWRFLVMTGSGYNDVVEKNRVEAIGPRDDDTIPGENAPEIILTESYRLHFEGRPAAISSDGRVLQIPQPQGDPAHSGDVVAILTGPEAGHWRRIAQALGSARYLMASPLPKGDYVISVATGFVNEAFRGNRVDSRGSTIAGNLILAGNHFGTRVLGNEFLGGRGAWRLTAFPTEAPVHWGWSHAPFLGGVIEDNTIEDAHEGAVICVDHGPAIKTTRGRVYLSATLRNNGVIWSGNHGNPARRDFSADKSVGLVLGEPGALDPGELVISAEGNWAAGPPLGGQGAIVCVHAARLNDEVITSKSLKLPARR